MHINRIFSLLFAGCILISFSIIFSACGQQTPPPAPTGFSAKAEIQFGEDSFVAEIAQTRPGALSFTFTAPENIAGFMLSLAGDNATLHFGSLQIELPANSLPVSNVAVLLNTVLLRMAQEQTHSEFTRTRDGHFVLQGTASNMPFHATIAQDGMLVQLEIPAIGLEIIVIS